jgi:ankyrin repeat protein
MPHAQTDLERRQICKLLQSVRNDDRDDIKRLIDGGVPDLINLTDPSAPDGGETALGLAASVNHDDMVQFLLDIGAHPDVADGRRRTPVMRAAEFGHVQSLEKLVNNKPAPNLELTDIDGKGALFYCIAPTKRHARCAELIVQNGADVNNCSKAGQPALVQACETAHENEQLCLTMLEKSADPNSKNKKTGRTALMAAASSGSTAVVLALLVRGAEVDELMTRRTHAVHEAAKKGHLEVLRMLSAYQATFDQIDDTSNTPIHYAAGGGHALCIRFLAQRGSNPKPKNRDGNTARLIARNAGHKDAMRECRRAERFFGRPAKNIEPWAIILYDFTCVHQAELLETFQKLENSESGKVSQDDFIETLQNAGAKVPSESEYQYIVSAHVKDRRVDYREFLTGRKYVNKQYLRSAYEGKKKKKKGGKGGRGGRGKTKVIMPICTRDEGPRAEDGGPPVVFVPKQVHVTDLSRFNRDSRPHHPIEDDSSWYLPPTQQPREHVRDLVRERDINTLCTAFDIKKQQLEEQSSPTPSPLPPLSPGRDRIDITDRFYKTPLMLACAQGDLDLVKLLVIGGANVNTRDNFKWTPLHFACHSGMKDVVGYLLDAGANLEAAAMNGATPLMRAIESSKADVVQLLLDRGAKMRVENRSGETPMDIATVYANYEVYEIIKKKWESLPPVKDKKGARKRPTAQRPKSTTHLNQHKMPVTQKPTDSLLHEVTPKTRQRRGSMIRSASVLAGSLDESANITYHPLTSWKNVATTESLINELVQRRNRYGWEVDFTDFKLPFLHNVNDKLTELKAAGEDF